MKFPFSSLMTVFLMSCSHLQDSKHVVEFPYASDLVEKVQKMASRMPASREETGISEKSPRRVYFSALYHQYLTLGQFLGKKSDVRFCPQFHHDKIETDFRHVPKVAMNRPMNEDEGKEFFPELAFSKEFSLKDYHKEIRQEIVGLCEEGVSDNFFKFDNLITHYAHKPTFHRDPKAMASVLKIPVFANFYLVKMLEIPGFNKTSLEEKHFIKLSRTHWFESYVAEASKVRGKYLKNKMVRR